MKKSTFVLIAVLLISGSCIYLFASGRHPETANGEQDLIEKVKALSVQLENMEKRIDVLAKQLTLSRFPLNKPLPLEGRVFRIEQQLSPHVKFAK